MKNQHQQEEGVTPTNKNKYTSHRLRDIELNQSNNYDKYKQNDFRGNYQFNQQDSYQNYDNILGRNDSSRLDDESMQISGLESSESPIQDNLDLSSSRGYRYKSYKTRRMNTQIENQLNSTQDREAFSKAYVQIKNQELKIKQLKIDLRDLHQRLKRSEQIKEKSLLELERIENENQHIQDENKELKGIYQTQDAEIKFLRQQNGRLKQVLKDKAMEQKDFLLGIDESLIDNLDDSYSTQQTYASKDHQSGRNNNNNYQHQNTNYNNNITNGFKQVQNYQEMSPGKQRSDSLFNSDKTQLDDIKRTLDQLTRQASQTNNNADHKNDQMTIKSAQEIAVLKSQVILLEQNNQQLKQSNTFSTESYQKLRQDYEHIKEKYIQLKDNFSIVQETKDRLESKNEQLQNQLNQLQKERDSYQYGTNNQSSGIKNQQQSESLQRQTVQKSKFAQISPSPLQDNSNNDNSQYFMQSSTNFEQVPPQQSLFDELQNMNGDSIMNMSNINKSKMQNTTVNTNMNNVTRNNEGQKTSQMQESTISKLMQIQSEITKIKDLKLEQANSQNSGNKTEENDIAVKNNMLLNMILTKLNEAQQINSANTQNQHQSQQNNSEKNQDSAHKKQSSSLSNGNDTNPSNNGQDSTKNHGQSQDSSRKSNRLSGSTNNNPNQTTILDVTGSIFPCIGKPLHKANQQDHNIGMNPSKQLFGQNGIMHTSKIMHAGNAPSEDPSFIDDYNMIIEQTSNRRKIDMGKDEQNYLEPIDEDENDGLNISHLSLQSYTHESVQTRQDRKEQFFKEHYKKIDGYESKSTKCSQDSGALRSNLFLNRNFGQKSRNSLQSNHVKSQPNLQNVFESQQQQNTQFNQLFSNVYNQPPRGGSRHLQTHEQKKSVKDTNSQSRNSSQRSVNTTLLLRQSLIGNYLLNYQATMGYGVQNNN
ncbi:UNKNOWN [Stylonychia lemnae]|uniref:Uncharacterized protein n=1 Tax=Stylonychia lemnae TaxID=5949 RepID=A0A078BBI0_STYLE|nr:UNKNOWN [Stylonychia lemnae]|eukprot:CDW90913.1 UNKNOWN [Stylonychia lemnae]